VHALFRDPPVFEMSSFTEVHLDSFSAEGT